MNRSKDMVPVNAGGIQVSVHRDIANLVAYLLNETVRRGYRLKPGQCWGYANRPIKGTTEASNHSWGLAVDLNSVTNPMAEHLVTDMPPWMPALWKTWGFRWGGSYQGRKDAMHYEFMGAPADARAALVKLAALDRPPPPMEVPPRMSPPVVIDGPVVDVLKAPSGGVWMLTEKGALYAWECPDKGAPNRHPEYWGSRKAARLERLDQGYTVVAATGERYDFP